MTSALLFSSSKSGCSGYLEHARALLAEYLDPVRKVHFVPYAGVRTSYDEYAERVGHALSGLGLEIVPIHRASDQKTALSDADSILIGGGNTFALLKQLQDLELFEVIRESVLRGARYVGWSAGSNMAGRTIRTTNDMPICEPHDFNAFGFVHFQINPHFTRETIVGHRGETRMERLTEFLQLNPGEKVIVLPEGAALEVDDGLYVSRGAAEITVLSLGQSGEIEEDRLSCLNGVPTAE